MTTHSDKWQAARARRAARRAADPLVQAKARAHTARVERDRQKELRRQAGADQAAS